MSTIDPSAAERMASSGKTFDRAARLLPRHSRALVMQLYSFCRQVDDVADESRLPISVRHGHLLAIEASLLGTAPPVIAFRSGWSAELDHALQQSRSSAVQLVRAVRQDLAQQQPKDETALEEYAFGVAGTVGLMLCDVLGARWEGRDAAVHLGIAMQISNIARDVAGDWQHGRVYLPESYISIAAVGDALLRKDRAAEHSLTLATTRLLALAERTTSTPTTASGLCPSACAGASSPRHAVTGRSVLKWAGTSRAPGIGERSSAPRASCA